MERSQGSSDRNELESAGIRPMTRAVRKIHSYSGTPRMARVGQVGSCGAGWDTLVEFYLDYSSFEAIEIFCFDR